MAEAAWVVQQAVCAAWLPLLSIYLIFYWMKLLNLWYTADTDGMQANNTLCKPTLTIITTTSNTINNNIVGS